MDNAEWADNTVQFARLLSEISTVGLSKFQELELCDSMSITREQLAQLFSRADHVWDYIKSEHTRDGEVDINSRPKAVVRGAGADSDSSSDAPGGKSTDGVSSDESSCSPVDVILRDEGTIVLFELHTLIAIAWVKTHVDNAMMLKGALVVEHRYVDLIRDAMHRDGLKMTIKY